MFYEYLPLERKGSFRCNDQLINRIWEVSAYTLHLTSREFFVDGIKRDRWVWSGDAAQSYLMNYYLFNDNQSVKRSIYALRGKDPVTSHINTIMDYTFYWFISIYDYYLYSGDRSFLEQIYPKMKTLMDFCFARTNDSKMLEGKAGDWIFIDWADFKMSKSGEVSFEQLLYWRSLQTMALCAEVIDNKEDKTYYKDAADNFLMTFYACFWSEKHGAFVHNLENNIMSEQVTPFTNIFAVIFDFLLDRHQEQVKNNVLLNDKALKITTPYMRFYELEALCLLGEHNHVLNEIRNYWGGMLDLGATSFWEKYNPNDCGAEHYAMYGRPYGKSLCHSWGASPLYLLGKYYLGVRPTTAGFQTYEIEPYLADLEWVEGDVPTPFGNIHVYCDSEKISVKADGGTGILRFTSQGKPECAETEIVKKENTRYEIQIAAGIQYNVKIG
ncbi:MAG: hypothetical protein LBV75_07945 [Paludibacter sp.]|jgi:hypothetical protein|nr:hypothetical protein [Paludibacter sp.]